MRNFATIFNYKYPLEGYIRYLYESVCVLDDILEGKNQG